MLRSKSRSGSSGFGQKSYNSVFSRTIAASKLCRGDVVGSQIDSTAHVSLDQKSSNKNSSENHTGRASTMQQLRKMGDLEEELVNTKVQLGVLEEERDRAINEVRKMKMVAHEANVKLNDALASKKASEVHEELKLIKEALANSKRELKLKENSIEKLRLELEKGKQLELNERNGSIARLKERIRELEAAVVTQKKHFEETNTELEESKHENDTLMKKLEMLAISSRESSGNDEDYHMVKENLVRVEEREKAALLQVQTLLEEMDSLKKEMKMALEAEEKSKKAMDDLASVLKEVMTEGNQAKEKLAAMQVELEHVKKEAEKLKTTVKTTEQELELYKNNSERLRLEAEESLLAWNDKEMGFVSCIKSAEDEKTVIQRENVKLLESVKAAENMTKVSKQENQKLRDILKQALNEANVSKEASGIAREENSQLKDCLSEKDKALVSLTSEIERLRIKEAAANKKLEELKLLISAAPKKEPDNKDKDEGWIFMSPSSSLSDQHEKVKPAHEENENENPEKAEALKGTIFDNKTQKLAAPHRQSGSSSTDDGEMSNYEDYDHLEGGYSDDAENDRSSSRKKRALIRRFGDLITMKKSFHKKDLMIPIE